MSGSGPDDSEQRVTVCMHGCPPIESSPTVCQTWLHAYCIRLIFEPICQLRVTLTSRGQFDTTQSHILNFRGLSQSRLCLSPGYMFIRSLCHMRSAIQSIPCKHKEDACATLNLLQGASEMRTIHVLIAIQQLLVKAGLVHTCTSVAAHRESRG